MKGAALWTAAASLLLALSFLPQLDAAYGIWWRLSDLLGEGALYTVRIACIASVILWPLIGIIRMVSHGGGIRFTAPPPPPPPPPPHCAEERAAEPLLEIAVQGLGADAELVLRESLRRLASHGMDFAAATRECGSVEGAARALAANAGCDVLWTRFLRQGRLTPEDLPLTSGCLELLQGAQALSRTGWMPKKEIELLGRMVLASFGNGRKR